MDAITLDMAVSEASAVEDLLDSLADELLSESDTPSYMTSMCRGGGGSTT